MFVRYLGIWTYLQLLEVSARHFVRSIADVALRFATRAQQIYNETVSQLILHVDECVDFI